MKITHYVQTLWISLIRWSPTPGGRGTLVSVSIHVVLLLILSNWLIERHPVIDRIATRILDSEPVEVELGLADVELFPDQTAEAKQLPQSVDVAAMLPKPELEIPVPDVRDPQGTPGTGKGTGKKKGKGTGKGSAPKHAVTKGSFTAWTVPEDPDPGQDYVIVIEVRLPEKIRRYPLKDLSGIVSGTDGWRQPLPGPNQGTAQVLEQKARLAIKVPGAPRLVRDTVRVRSRILKEQQTLEIVF